MYISEPINIGALVGGVAAGVVVAVVVIVIVVCVVKRRTGKFLNLLRSVELFIHLHSVIRSGWSIVYCQHFCVHTGKNIQISQLERGQRSGIDTIKHHT